MSYVCASQIVFPRIKILQSEIIFEAKVSIPSKLERLINKKPVAEIDAQRKIYASICAIGVLIISRSILSYNFKEVCIILTVQIGNSITKF